MYKKIFVALAILTIGIFSFSICFANNDHMLEDAANGVRNVEFLQWLEKIRCR